MFTTAKKLAAYFQLHPIQVMTDQPLGMVMRNPTSSSRLIKWAMMLTEYRLRTAVKGQALADFIVEYTARDPESNHSSQLEEP